MDIHCVVPMCCLCVYLCIFLYIYLCKDTIERAIEELYEFVSPVQVPMSEGGYIIGTMCVICGVLTVAFTVPIVVNNFTLYYMHAQSRNQLPPQKKLELQRKLILKNQRAAEFIKRLAINVQNRRQNTTAIDGFNKLEDMKTPRTMTSR